jgi:hypothetical protein
LPEDYIDDFRIFLQSIIAHEKAIVTAKDEGVFIGKKK